MICKKCGKFYIFSGNNGICSNCAITIRLEQEAAAKRDSEMKQAAVIREAKNVERYCAFLNAIPAPPIPIQDAPKIKLDPERLDTITFRNITAKTNIEKLTDFTAIDTETTGLHSGNDRIVEVAAIRFRDSHPVERFTALINPLKPIPADATKINGITDADVAGAPEFRQIAPALLQFIGADNLIGHNLEFDLKFLYRGGLDFLATKRLYYDTLSLSRHILKDYTVDYKLVTFSKFFQIRPASMSHRALSDAYASAILFMHLIMERTGHVRCTGFNDLHFG